MQMKERMLDFLKAHKNTMTWIAKYLGLFLVVECFQRASVLQGITYIFQNPLVSIYNIFLLVFLQIGFAYIQLKINSIRNTINGKPSTIINKGKLNIKEMIKQRYSIDDLLIALRNNGYRGIHEIEYAILETNGNLSVFPKDKKNDSEYPFPIIVDGVVDIDSLKGINRSEFWLKNFLLVRGYDIKNILYAFYKKGKIFIVKK